MVDMLTAVKSSLNELREEHRHLRESQGLTAETQWGSAGKALGEAVRETWNDPQQAQQDRDADETLSTQKSSTSDWI